MIFLSYDSIDSTNDESKRQASLLSDDVLSKGVVITAHFQTSGRGQFDRAWHSAEGGLYFTFMIKPSPLFFEHFLQHEYQPAISRVIQRCLVEFSCLNIDLEWPNDLILNGRKVGGILIETMASSSCDKPSIFIIGVGINVNQIAFPEYLKFIAISFRQMTGKRYNMDRLTKKLSKELYLCLS